ncbi:MAG: hypothetical protein JO048_10500, partial [Methylobacteriaceae bacterium]|nr:hypothetical protein [Methylobacteriaceae bacterium]
MSDDSRSVSGGGERPPAAGTVRAPAAATVGAGRPETARESAAARFAIDAGAIAALAEARHADPFAVLGPHPVGRDAYEIRAIFPGAEAVSVLLDRGADPVPMTRVHPAGIYVARIEAAERPGYRLRITWPAGVQETRDAYSYGPVPGYEEMWRVRDVGSCELPRL